MGFHIKAKNSLHQKIYIHEFVDSNILVEARIELEFEDTNMLKDSTIVEQ